MDTGSHRADTVDMNEDGHVVSMSETEQYTSWMDEMKLKSGLTAAILSTISQVNKGDVYLEIRACNWARVTPYVFSFPWNTYFFSNTYSMQVVGVWH